MDFRPHWGANLPPSSTLEYTKIDPKIDLDRHFFLTDFDIDFQSIVVQFGTQTWPHVGHFSRPNTIFLANAPPFGSTLAPCWLLGTIFDLPGPVFGSPGPLLAPFRVDFGMSGLHLERFSGVILHSIFNIL